VALAGKGLGFPTAIHFAEIRFCRGREIEALWREATTWAKRTHRFDDNVVIIRSEQGNSRAYTLVRLKRESPDFHDIKGG
jgi:hypothetical protein